MYSQAICSYDLHTAAQTQPEPHLGVQQTVEEEDEEALWD